MLNSFFYLTSFSILISLVFSITAKKSVHSVLWLVCAFFSTSWLYIIFSANFLAMLLIIVYVGAIATLFLFVVMMADSKPRSISKTKSFLQLSLILLVLFVLNIVFYIKKPVINFSSHLIVQNNFTVYNTTLFSIGDELYTKYAFLFEICGFILFATMIGVIYMVKHYGFLNSETKRTQSVSAQVLKNAKDCVELIKDVKSGYGID